MKPTDKNNTTNGSTLSPSASSVKSFNMAAEEPLAPAERAEFGVELALSLALRRLAKVLAPPGTAEEDYSNGYVS